MSDEETLDAGSESAPVKAVPEERLRYKSWRKKYRKMRVRFDSAMHRNSTLFKEEQKLEAIAKRLQENNDQLLDLLLDLNSSLSIPPQLRTDLHYEENDLYAGGMNLQKANRALHDAYEAGEYGRVPRTQFSQLKETLEAHVAATEAYELEDRNRMVPHPKFYGDAEAERALEELTANAAGYLTTAHEEDYLLRLDAKNEDPALALAKPAPPPAAPAWTSLTPREMEREVEIRNPLSVHNWLKKHNISIGDTDEKSEVGATTKKGGRSLARKVGERAVEKARPRDDDSPMSTATKLEHDDEEEIFDDMGGKGSGGGRRSRGAVGAGDDDTAYRPKGGRGGKIKRKREDGDPKSGHKRPKTSLAGPGDA